eukprot:1035611-Rhodomonas_salina.1
MAHHQAFPCARRQVRTQREVLEERKRSIGASERGGEREEWGTEEKRKGKVRTGGGGGHRPRLTKMCPQSFGGTSPQVATWHATRFSLTPPPFHPLSPSPSMFALATNLILEQGAEEHSGQSSRKTRARWFSACVQHA